MTSDATVERATLGDMPSLVLYEVLRLRSAVFVVEQDCVFAEMDGCDGEPGVEHLWISDDQGVAATCRLVPDRDGTWTIGRVATRIDARGRGLGARIVRAALDRLSELGAVEARIGAQARLRRWYEGLGFRPDGPWYLEDEILHRPMSVEVGAR